jgi:glycosyltransferase involved in cell wall biosynthesis
MFSIVMPLYNKENDVRDTINSIINQSFTEFELLIVDDGSVDQSLNIISTIKDSRIKVIKQANQGVSAARNKGIENAKYNLIALIDADDLWENKFLEEIKLLINDFPEASIFGSAWAYLDSTKSIKKPYSTIEKGYRGYVANYFTLAIENAFLTSSSVVFLKSSFYEIGRFNEKLSIGEDIDLWIRFGLNKKIGFVNKTFAYYKIDSSEKTKLKKIEFERCLINNLSNYKNLEKNHLEFKTYLDYWRYFQIKDYFDRRRLEIRDVKKILNEMNLNNFPKIFNIIKHAPYSLHRPLYLFHKMINQTRLSVSKIFTNNVD